MRGEERRERRNKKKDKESKKQKEKNISHRINIFHREQYTPSKDIMFR